MKLRLFRFLFLLLASGFSPFLAPTYARDTLRESRLIEEPRTVVILPPTPRTPVGEQIPVFSNSKMRITYARGQILVTQIGIHDGLTLATPTIIDYSGRHARRHELGPHEIKVYLTPSRTEEPVLALVRVIDLTSNTETFVLATPEGLIRFPPTTICEVCKSFSITESVGDSRVKRYSLVSGDSGVFPVTEKVIANATFKINEAGLIEQAFGSLSDQTHPAPAQITAYYLKPPVPSRSLTDRLHDFISWLRNEPSSRRLSDLNRPGLMSLSLLPNPEEANNQDLFLKIKQHLFDHAGIKIYLGTDYYGNTIKILGTRTIPSSIIVHPSPRSEPVTRDVLAVLVWFNNQPNVFIISDRDEVFSFGLPQSLSSRSNLEQYMALAINYFIEAEIRFVTLHDFNPNTPFSPPRDRPTYFVEFFSPSLLAPVDLLDRVHAGTIRKNNGLRKVPQQPTCHNLVQ